MTVDVYKVKERDRAGGQTNTAPDEHPYANYECPPWAFIGRDA